MRALLSGERAGSPAQVALSVALLAVAVVAVALAWNAFSDAGHARHELLTVKQTIYTRCQQRQVYDQAAHDDAIGHRDAVRADLAQQAALLGLFRSNRRLVGILERKIRADRVAISKDTVAIERGVIGQCQVYR